MPFRELIQRALPKHLFLVLADRTQAVFVEGKGIRAPEQGATSWPFPFTIFLLEIPRLELCATPTKIFRGDSMKGGESGNAKPGQNLRGNFIKTSRPATK